MDNTTLPPFNPSGELGGVFPRWEKWLRAVELYIASKNITDAARKKAILLHMGGFELQDIFYSIPDGDTVAEGENAYEKTKNTLTAYFKPKTNKTYERHVFRSLWQNEGEPINQFITRLRQQAKYCGFTSVEDEIRDQIIEKCRSEELKKRFLEKGDITLSEVIDIAQAHEVTGVQIKNMGTTETIAKITEKNNFRKKPSQQKRETSCFRCGYPGHLYWDPNCPAKGKNCVKCNKPGHFASVCKSKAVPDRNRRNGERGRTTARSARVRNLENREEEEEYAFTLEEGAQQLNVVKEQTVEVQVGGVCLNLLIDSGASCNVIGEDLWEYCKKNNIKCKSKKYLIGKSFLMELDLLGEFDCNVKVGNKEIDANFVVVKGKGRGLLGFETAVRLEILKIGPQLQINHVSMRKELFSGIGKLKDFQLKLPIDPLVPPVAQALRRVPFKIRDQVEEQINRLLREDIIERVEGPTPWVSPVVPVVKDSGKFRLCVDMRRANQAIVRERFPLPVLEEVLDKISGSNWFSTLDIRDAYHQIELDEKSREITTFVIDSGLYRYKRLMFGLSCAPEMFQRILRTILQDCEGAENFLDDIIIHGKTREQHDDRLSKVCKTLEEKGLTLNQNKCKFAKNEIEFLGFKITGSGYKPLESKVEAVQNFRTPRTPEEIRGFLGLVNFCASFIPNLAQISEPLRRLTRKSEKFNWTEEQEKSFLEIKRLMSDAGTLGIYNKNAHTKVIADAGPDALGAVLVQKGSSGWQTICYASRSLTDCEKRYSQTEKEALALVFACERFHQWLYGIHFILVTDHKPLEYLFTPRSKPNARIERWVLRLQPYSYQVKYEKGNNNIADPLSRLVKFNQSQKQNMDDLDDHVYWVVRESVPRALTMQEINRESEKDATLIEVRRAIETSNWDRMKTSRFKILKDELCVYDKIVMRGTRIVIPSGLQQKVLAVAHEGHPGIVAMKNRLRSKVWWEGIDKMAEKYVRACKGCQLVQNTVNLAPLNRNKLPEKPWEILAMDFLGPLPTKEYLLVIIDYYSRFYEVVVTFSINASTLIKHLTEIFARHGLPRIIICDNGPQMASAELESWAENQGIAIKHSAPLWPQANGEIERQNRSLLKRLKIAHVEKLNWKQELFDYLLMYRSTPHSTTGVSPAELLFNRKIRTKLPELGSNDSLLDEEIREKDAWVKERGRIYYDQRNKVKDSCLQPGDTVFMRKEKDNKLSCGFDSTEYQITNRVGNTVTVASPAGNTFTRNVSAVKKVYNGETDPSETVTIKSEVVESDPEPEETLPGNLGEHNVSCYRPTSGRPQRQHKLPSRFVDYVPH